MHARDLWMFRNEMDERAHEGLGWLVAHVDELRPAAAMTRWTSADRARMAAAECAVACRPLARLVALRDRVYVGLLGDWLEHLAVPELIAWSRSGAPAWYRPLVLTAGALAGWGSRIPALDSALRTYGPPTAARNQAARPDEGIETMYWWGKRGLADDGAAVDAACEDEIRRLWREPMNPWTARALNRTILYQSDLGRMPEPVSRAARQLLRRASRVAAASGEAELAAGCALSWWCLGAPWSDELHPLLATLARAQQENGAFVPHVHRTAVGSAETERCARSTLAGVLGCLALARGLGERRGAPVYLAPMDAENTANAAQ